MRDTSFRQTALYAILALCAPTAVASVIPASVLASQLTYQNTTYILTGASGEENTMSVTESVTPYIVFEDGAGITLHGDAAARGCARWSDTRAACPVIYRLHYYRVALRGGDRNDTLTGFGDRDAIGRAYFNAGSGNDTVDAFESASGTGVAVLAYGGGGEDYLSPNGGHNGVRLVTNDDGGDPDTVECKDPFQPRTAPSVDAQVDLFDTVLQSGFCHSVIAR